MTPKLTLQDFSKNFSQKRVLMRVDFNVPMVNGKITDDFRIVSSLPSISYILQEGGIVILMSHLGQPKGKKDPKLSLEPCAKHLETLLKKPVLFIKECVGSAVENEVKKLQPGSVALLENLRFEPGEEDPKNFPDFAKNLAKLGEIYVNDAFGTAHRKHASTYILASYFPKTSLMGFLMEKEVRYLSEITDHPKHPFYAVIGGAKISSKIKVLTRLIEKVDALYIGGAMSYTFFRAKNYSMGSSLVEEDQILEAKKILLLCEEKKLPVFLPEDLVIAEELKENTMTKVITPAEGIFPPWQGVDIGPKTLQTWKKNLSNAAMIFWNGPLGVFEIPSFSKGTNHFAYFLSKLQKTTTIVGGGDSASAIHQLHLEKEITHLSTGGGASLEWIEKGSLPGVDVLTEKS